MTILLNSATNDLSSAASLRTSLSSLHRHKNVTGRKNRSIRIDLCKNCSQKWDEATPLDEAAETVEHCRNDSSTGSQKQFGLVAINGSREMVVAMRECLSDIDIRAAMT